MIEEDGIIASRPAVGPFLSRFRTAHAKDEIRKLGVRHFDVIAEKMKKKMI